MKWLRNIAVFGALALAGIAHAQSVGTGTGVDPVQYTATPDVPGPHAPVSLTVEGVGTFIGDATITWRVNGVVAKQGVGASTFSLTTGDLGQQTTVSVSIDSATQGTITHLFTFIPSTVDLVWEADTSVPPLYPGHALYSAGSNLTVVAFPTVIVSGKKVAPQSLSYQWSIDDNPVTASSGTGKYTLSFTGDQLHTEEDVALDVYFGTLKVGHAELTVPASQPELLFYDKDPLRGIIWDQALPGSIALNAQELTLQAQPYFFANNGSYSWSWTMEGSPVTGPDSDKGVLTLRQSGQGTGSASLVASLQNLSDTQLLQSAQAALTIVFGQKASGISTFFGL